MTIHAGQGVTLTYPIPSEWSALGGCRVLQGLKLTFHLLPTFHPKFPPEAVEEIDNNANDQPDAEPYPCPHRKSCHEEEAEDDAEDGDDRDKGTSEGSVKLGSLLSEDNNADTYEDKGKEGADIAKVGYCLDR